MLKHLCECNCGGYAKAGNRFINGHNGRGKPSPNSGKKEKHRPGNNLCECHCGKFCINRFYNGHNRKGITTSDLTKSLLSESGKIHHADFSGENNPFYGKCHTDESKEKQKIKGKKLWEDPNYRAVVISKILKGSGKHPNKKEKKVMDLLDEYFPGVWKYCGNGSNIIGGKCPDFIDIFKKLLIEFQGCYFHKCSIHNPDSKFTNDFEERKQIFGKEGYKTIEIWEHDLCRSKLQETIQKIRDLDNS